MTTVTAVIEFLVGVACIAFAWPCWRRHDVQFRVLSGCLVLAGGIAIASAITTLV